MRLVSATVRNYRLHDEVTVGFDPARTVIGGPNESGKSTLIEAIHRCLFLKATTTGELKRGMDSTRHHGHPEVEVHFETRGAEYQLAKRFSGANGTTRLTQVGGRTWQGPEAEERLAELLGVDDLSGARVTPERVKKQWAHLWVWQGESGEDPSGCVVGQRVALLDQLQKMGGAVAMQSALDGRVSLHFSQERDQVFTLAGNPKRGSELEKAQTEAQQAEDALAAAVARLDSLRRAVDDNEAAASSIARTAAELDDIGRQRREVAEQLSQVDELRRAEEIQAATVSGIREKLELAEDVEEDITELSRSIAALQRSLEPKIEELGLLDSRLAELRTTRSEVEQAYDRALATTRAARLAKELAAAYVDRFQREARAAELGARLERVRTLENDIDLIRSRIAELAPIEQKGLEELQALENKLVRASAALSAMATEVEVVAADRPVRVGEARLDPGARQTVSDPTDLAVGDTVRIRIYPGGGDALARVREEVRDFKAALQSSLDGSGVGSVAQAAEVVTRRADLQSQLASKEAALEEWNAEDLALQLKEVQEKSTSIGADIKRKSEQLAAGEAPGTLLEAQAWLDREAERLQGVEPEEIRARAALDAASQQLADCENQSSASREALEQERQRLTGLSAQLELLRSTHGDDDARGRRLAETRETKARVDAEFEATREALQALQPSLLEADRDRLQRAWEETDRQRRDAETKYAVSQAALRSDGADDPYAAVAQARARRDAANEHRETVERKSAALRLVDDLFRQEQQALADQFSRPLAEKITSYVQCLFGPEAVVDVIFEEDRFEGVQLVRPAVSGSESFDSLSEGAREQVAAAVRLAIAELLATDHDGSLPVVFDDAFAYSDPERANTLQRMLDLGAARGLQIIVLTCNPSDYASLGARQVVLACVSSA